MKKHEQLLEDYEDACFAILMECVAIEEGKRLERINQQLCADPNSLIPESTHQKCLRTIAECFSRKRRQKSLRRVAHTFRIAAVVAIIAVFIFTTACAVSESFRVATRNVIITVNEKYTEFTMGFENQESNLKTEDQNNDDVLFDKFKIGWIPEDFWLSKNQYNHWAFYENPNGSWIQVLFGNNGSSIQLDTETADVENDTIHDLPAVVIEKENTITIILSDVDQGAFYTVMAQGIDLNTVKQIAENFYF